MASSDCWYETGNIRVEVDGRVIHHRLPGPFTVERFKNGACCVLNAQGINWTHIEDGKGQTLFANDEADALCAALNSKLEAHP